VILAPCALDSVALLSQPGAKSQCDLTFFRENPAQRWY
jgi:hypothetical protein